MAASCYIDFDHTFRQILCAANLLAEKYWFVLELLFTHLLALVCTAFLEADFALQK